MSPQTIAHYRITAKIGEGGMGAVYRATDTKLGRSVALKVLPDIFASDPDRFARFTREAQVLASLNHPNIAAIYGVEERALVLELVEGATLAERLAQGPMTVEESLPLIQQLIDALEYAHESGVIHRDLKSANVKVTSDGRLKVLDFGLAKALSADAAASDHVSSPTLTMRATIAGVIMGTPGYMAPEQARGHEVDKRADIWAFGVLFFEMLTGRQPFAAETVSDTLAAVLRADLQWSTLPAHTPEPVRRLLRRCLERDRKKRLRDIGDARIILDEAPPTPVPVELPLSARSPRRIGWVTAVIAAAAAGAACGIGWYATRPAPLQPLIRISAALGPGIEISTMQRTGSPLALSPDGAQLAAVLDSAGVMQIGTMLLRQGRMVPLVGTEGGESPFFSPDGRWIGFRAQSRLKKIPIEGRTAVAISPPLATRGASWGEDGYIVTTSEANGTLVRVPSTGGNSEPVGKLGPKLRAQRWPQVLPGGDLIFFTSLDSGRGEEGSIYSFSRRTGEHKLLQQGAFSGQYLPSGHFIYMQGSALFAAAFDLRRGAVTSPAVPVLEDVATTPFGSGAFAWARNGTFVYLTGNSEIRGWSLSWLEPTGKAQPVLQAHARYSTPRASPDGKRVAYSLLSAGGEDIWVRDLARGIDSRVTFMPGVNTYPIWMPDGAAIIFRAVNAEKPGLYWIRADGGGEPKQMLGGASIPFPISISPDGKRLACSAFTPGGTLDLYTARVERDAAHPRLSQLELFAGTSSTEASPSFSPDGRWIAYSADDTGMTEVYVRPFPGPGGKWQVSTGGGQFPRWSPSSRELVYLGPASKLWAVPFTAGADSFSPGKPRLWSDERLINTSPSPNFDISGDGKRVLALTPSEGSDGQRSSAQLIFLLNFFDELRRRTGK